MSGETGEVESGWTVDTLRILLEERRQWSQEIRGADEKFAAERDRRYAEVALEREKALKIKETADLAALGLAREIQDYKDEKANKLREQIEGERGDYASKSDLIAAVKELNAIIAPTTSFVTEQRARDSSASAGKTGRNATTVIIVAAVGVSLTFVVGVIGIVIALLTLPK